MAKDKLTEYDATAANNTVVGDVNLAENSCLPSDLNNAVREVMSHLKNFSDGTDAISGLTVEGAATITTADNNPQLTLKSTDADGGRGPELLLTRDSASPADGDAIGFISWTSDNDAGASHAFCGIEVLASDVSDGSEDATWQLFTQVAGTSRSRFSATPTETVFNEDSQDIDLRVEGNGDANLLFVDAGNDRIGIGTNSPTKQVSAVIDLNDTDGFALEYLGDAKAGLLVNPASGEVRMGAINSNGTYFTTLYSNNSERLRILSSGDVLLGKSAAGFDTVGLEVASTGRGCFTRDGGTPLFVNRKSSDGTILEVRKDNTAKAQIGSLGVRGYFAADNAGISPYQNVIYPTNGTGFAVDNTVDIGHSSYRFNDLYLGGNLYLGGTGSANALDDYEEGTFTPVIDGEGSCTIGTSSVIGLYTKIGRLVNCAISYNINSVSGGASNLAVDISGLPFTTNTNTNFSASIRVQSLASAVEGVQVVYFNNATSGRIEEFNGTGSTNFSDHVASNSVFIINVTYMTA